MRSPFDWRLWRKRLPVPFAELLVRTGATGELPESAALGAADAALELISRRKGGRGGQRSI